MMATITSSELHSMHFSKRVYVASHASLQACAHCILCIYQACARCIPRVSIKRVHIAFHAFIKRVHLASHPFLQACAHCIPSISSSVCTLHFMTEQGRQRPPALPKSRILDCLLWSREGCWARSCERAGGCSKEQSAQQEEMNPQKWIGICYLLLGNVISSPGCTVPKPSATDLLYGSPRHLTGQSSRERGGTMSVFFVAQGYANPLHHLAHPHYLAPSRTISHIHRTISHHLAPSRTISHHLAPSRTSIAPSRTISHHLAPSRTILHHLAPSRTSIAPSRTISHIHRTISHHLAPSRTISHIHCTISHGVMKWMEVRGKGCPSTGTL